MRSITLLATLSLLAAVFAPGATAAIPGVSPGVGDNDDDGLAEADGHVITPPCACYCPGVYTGVDASVAGQRVYVVGATALCQHGVVYDVDPNDPDASDGVHFVPILGTFGSLGDLSN